MAKASTPLVPGSRLEIFPDAARAAWQGVRVRTPQPNRLGAEKSPYLLQHAHNPVDWHPWGEEAFARARAEQKPIFLSVGYSTCHWCHVMERESFEQEETARLLNAGFISIKVDREERPDVDRVYMTFVQATTGSGGWPMSVWLTPELQPFAGGTYFPPEDRYGRPGFKTVLARLAQAWAEEREGVREQGAKIAGMLREYAEAQPAAAEAPGAEALQAGFAQVARGFDAEEGGFGGAPKFPRPVLLDFLLAYSAANPASAEGQQAREMAFHTLRKMAAGGMHDQLGGGFHRYSVDRLWHIPHFEKMLYDQAQLTRTYVAAWQVNGEPLFAETARGILDYVSREMTSEEGGFFSAEDADSLPPEGGEEKREGAYYVWSEQEVNAVLKAAGLEGEAGLFKQVYGVEAGGNAPEGSDPHGEFAGLNTLIRRMTAEEAAGETRRPVSETEQALARCRAALWTAREDRARPHLDDKIIAAWNGMMISAFARAGMALADDGYVAAARKAAAFIKENLWLDGTLRRSYRQGAGETRGFADDYAQMAGGALDLYEATGEIEWLRWAVELQGRLGDLFGDEQGGGYFSTEAGEAHLFVRLKEDHDGAEPSPNSVAARTGLRLGRMLGAAEMERAAERAMRAFGEVLQRSPSSMPAMLEAVQLRLARPRQIVIAGEPQAAETQALARVARALATPDVALLYADGADGQRWLGERLEFIRGMGPVEGKAAAYVCENFTCKLPITDLGDLRAALR